MSMPLVTIVVLSYNHTSFLEECLESVFSQNYEKIEVIIVDDFSNDDSQAKIVSFLEKRDLKVQCIFNQRNLGNCKSFNQALDLSKGKYIIDLAADDVLYLDSVEKKVAFFESRDPSCAMIYSDAEYIDEDSNSLGIYSDLKKQNNFPSGKIFEEILSRHFICPPTTVFRTETLKSIGGYDEFLTYEDFDVWLRLSKKNTVEFQDVVTIKRRINKESLSNQFRGTRRTEMLDSTLQICKKVETKLINDSEKEALVKRVKFELRFAMRQNQKEIVSEYIKILRRLGEGSFVHRVLSCFI